MNAQVGRTSAIQIGARSLLAFALEPKAPLAEWLATLDEWLTRSPNFFASKPVILQMGGLEIPLKEYRDLLGQLARRHIRVMAVENSHRLLVGPHLPPVVSGGRVASPEKLLDETPAAAPAPAAPAPAPPPAPAPAPPRPLYHEGNLRSGQQIVHLEGDVIVIGRVASGAEIVAGGSVHVYGALQGRAFAGVAGSRRCADFLPRGARRAAVRRRGLRHRRGHRRQIRGSADRGQPRRRPHQDSRSELRGN